MEKELIETVREMRKLQKEYFRTRNPRVMEDSKALERKVDKMLEEIDLPSLF